MKLGVEEILIIILGLIILYNFSCKIEGLGCRQYATSCTGLKKNVCETKFIEYNGPRKCTKSLLPWLDCTPSTDKCYNDCQCDESPCNRYKHCTDISALDLDPRKGVPDVGLKYFRPITKSGDLEDWQRNDNKLITPTQKAVLEKLERDWSIIDISAMIKHWTHGGIPGYGYTIYFKTHYMWTAQGGPLFRFYDESKDYYDASGQSLTPAGWEEKIDYNSDKPTIKYIASNGDLS